MRPITLSDKIKNAPEGSRIRELFYDSSDDETSRPRENNSQKSPARLQTQPESVCLTSKLNPDSGTSHLSYPHEDTCLNEALEGHDDIHSSNSELKMNIKIPRVSLSPPPVKSRTNPATISSLEALTPSSLDPYTAETCQSLNPNNNNLDKMGSKASVLHPQINEETPKQNDTTDVISRKRKVSEEKAAAKKIRKEKKESGDQENASKKKPRKRVASLDVADTVIAIEKTTIEQAASAETTMENQKPIKKRNLKLDSTDTVSIGKEFVEPSILSASVCTKLTSDLQEMSSNVQRTDEKPELSMTSISEKISSKEATASSSILKVRKRTLQDQVLAEMFFSCRVYNLKTLAQVLQTTEVALRFLMLSLLDKDIVRKKEFNSKSGKTKELYWANQDSKAKELQKLIPTQHDIEIVQQQSKSLSHQYDNLCRELAILTEQLGNDEIDSRIHSLETTVQSFRNEQQECQERIEAFSAGMSSSPHSNKNQGNSAVKNEMEKDPHRLVLRILAMREEWQSRKRKSMDFVDQLADGMEKKPRDIIKLLDIETDEMEGVTMPPKRTIADTKLNRSEVSQAIRK
jgi:hypothetical protein